MSYRVLRDSLASLARREPVDTFGLLAQLSSFTSLAGDEDQLQQAREILVRVLEQRVSFEAYTPIVQALLRNVGLFPYLSRSAKVF